MPVKDDGHPLPYQDHQRCNNGTPPLTKEDAATAPFKWFTASMLSAPFSLSLSLARSLSLSLFLSPPSSQSVHPRNGIYYYRLYPFRDCRSNLRALNLNWARGIYRMRRS